MAERPTSAQLGVDPAVHRAREVVGLYGDPTASFGIGVEVEFERPLIARDLELLAAAEWAARPHLGQVPEIERAGSQEWSSRRADVCARPYERHGPLTRVLLAADPTRLVVAAHHGAVDGLGLLGLVGLLTGTSISTGARGIADRRSAHSFVRTSARRALEAVWRPPVRFPGHGSGQSPGSVGAGSHEELSDVVLPSTAVGTADLVAALLVALDERAHVGRRNRVLLIGASRRTTPIVAPDRATAYLRLTTDRRLDAHEVRSRLEALEPEPDFPETSAAGLGPAITRLMRARLGATALVSNLGLIDGPGLRQVIMFPAPSGPRAVAVGLASTRHSTTVSLRTRRSEFTRAEHEQLLSDVATALAAGSA